MDAHLDGPAAMVRVAGAQGTDVSKLQPRSRRILAVAEGTAVQITVILMIIVFGSLVAVLLPLATLGLGDLRHVRGAWNRPTHVTSVSVFAINLATGLGLGLGMDYALLMVSWFRE